MSDRDLAKVIPLSRLPKGASALLEPSQEQPLEFKDLPEAKRGKAQLRYQLVARVQEIAEADEVSLRVAAEKLAQSIKVRGEHRTIHEAAAKLSRKTGCPSRASLCRWVADYQKDGLLGLVDHYKGRRRKGHDWELRALQLWLTHNQADPGSITFWLRHEGFDARYHQVRRFVKSLPETYGKRSRHRLGAHHYDQNVKPHVVRDYSEIPVGFVYEGDGHCCDFYVAHPKTGNPVRLEFTPWIDWRSHYVPGWFLWDRESGLNTVLSLSRAIVAENHVPAAIHVDPGSGFRNRIMSDEAAGYLTKLGIESIFALPGNARGKGLVEGFFKHFEARLGKRFATYCGHDRTDEGLSRLRDKVKRGEILLPTYEEALAAIAEYIAAYNAAPQKSLGNRSPAEIWQSELQRVALETPAEALHRLAEPRTVRRWRVTIHHRHFQHEVLAEHEGRRVVVEYDPFDWDQVWIYDEDRRFITIARQVDRQAALPDSRVKDLQQKRLRHQIRRKEQAIEEDKARAGLAVTHDQVLDDIEALNAIDEQPGRRAIGHEEKIDLLGELLNEEGAGEPAPGSSSDE